MHSEYEKWGLVGDFNILAIITSSLAGILVIPVIFLFPDIALLDKIFSCSVCYSCDNKFIFYCILLNNIKI